MLHRMWGNLIGKMDASVFNCFLNKPTATITKNEDTKNKEILLNQICDIYSDEEDIKENDLHSDSDSDSDYKVSESECSNISSEDEKTSSNVITNITSKPYKRFAKKSFAGLLITSGDGWNLCGKLTNGEKQQPVIDELIRLIYYNMLQSVREIPGICARGDGTQKNRYIMEYVNQQMIDAVQLADGTYMIWHKPTDEGQDTSEFKYNLYTFQQKKLMIVKFLYILIFHFNYMLIIYSLHVNYIFFIC